MQTRTDVLVHDARFIRDSLPPGGLFAGLEWKISPAPFLLSVWWLARKSFANRVAQG
jgi:hypothetical protein